MHLAGFLVGEVIALAFLGGLASAFDNLVDRAPAGSVSRFGGALRMEYRGNWKLHHENANDVMHACFVHESSVAAARADQRDYAARVFDAHQTHVQLLSNGFSVKDWLATGVWGTEGGHTYMGGFYKSGVLSPERTDGPGHVLVGVTRAALKERQYSAVMAATGLLYLAILTAFGTDLVARAVLAG